MRDVPPSPAFSAPDSSLGSAPGGDLLAMAAETDPSRPGMARPGMARPGMARAGLTRGSDGAMWRRVALIGLTVALCAVVLALNLSLPTHIDAFQYLASAAFWADPGVAIYRDYMHSQTPYQPVLLGLWTQMINIEGVGLYLEGRLFNAFWSMLFVIALVRLLAGLSGNLLWTVLGVLAVFTSTYMDLPLRTVRNDMLPLFLATVALIVLLPALRGGPDRAGALRYAVAAALIGVATMTKQSYAFAAMGLFAFALTGSYDTWRDRLRMAALPVAIGGALGGLPGLIVIVQNWHNAHFALLEFHRTAHLEPYVADPQIGPTLRDQALWMFRALADMAMAVMVLCILATGGWLLHRHRLRAAGALPVFDRRLLLLCAVTAGCIALSFFAAMPLHWQYAAPILPFVAAIMAVLSAMALAQAPAGAARHLLGGVLPAGALALVLASSVGLIKHNAHGHWTMSAFDHVVYLLRDPVPNADRQVYAKRTIGDRKWLWETLTPMTAQIHAILTPEARAGGLRVATDMAAYPLEAGLGIYPELASMPFYYSENDHIDPDRLERLTGVSVDTITDWMARNDVRAVMVGDDNTWNKGTEMEAFAVARGLACFTIEMRGAFLIDRARFYVDPALATGPGTC